MDTKILDVNSAAPQFFKTEFVDRNNNNKFMMVYTGELGVGHGAEDDLTNLRIEYPLLAWDKDANGNDTLAIYHFPDPDLVEAAVASAAHSYIIVKDTRSLITIMDIRADIKTVLIRKMQQTPDGRTVEVSDAKNLLVLSMQASSEESEIATISYNVTVIGNLRQLFPILRSDPTAWTGSYERVLNPPLKLGNPINNLFI